MVGTTCLTLAMDNRGIGCIFCMCRWGCGWAVGVSVGKGPGQLLKALCRFRRWHCVVC